MRKIHSGALAAIAGLALAIGPRFTRAEGSQDSKYSRWPVIEFDWLRQTRLIALVGTGPPRQRRERAAWWADLSSRLEPHMLRVKVTEDGLLNKIMFEGRGPRKGRTLGFRMQHQIVDEARALDPRWKYWRESLRNLMIAMLRLPRVDYVPLVDPAIREFLSRPSTREPTLEAILAHPSILESSPEVRGDLLALALRSVNDREDLGETFFVLRILGTKPETLSAADLSALGAAGRHLVDFDWDQPRFKTKFDVASTFADFGARIRGTLGWARSQSFFDSFDAVVPLARPLQVREGLKIGLTELNDRERAAVDAFYAAIARFPDVTDPLARVFYWPSLIHLLPECLIGAEVKSLCPALKSLLGDESPSSGNHLGALVISRLTKELRSLPNGPARARATLVLMDAAFESSVHVTSLRELSFFVIELLRTPDFRDSVLQLLPERKNFLRLAGAVRDEVVRIATHVGKQNIGEQTTLLALRVLNGASDHLTVDQLSVLWRHARKLEGKSWPPETINASVDEIKQIFEKLGKARHISCESSLDPRRW